MFEKVLVAVDGSPAAAHAVSAAKELASLSGGQVRVVHVREFSAAPRGGRVSSEGSQEAEKIVEDTIAELVQAGVAATGIVRAARYGHVATELLDEASEWNASVILIASRGLSDLAGLVIGSTTHKVLHLGRVPVLVVR